MAYPTDTTVRETILANIDTTLAAIATTPLTYKTVPNTVRRWTGNVFEVPSYPCIIVVPTGETHDDSRIAIVQHTMDLLIVCGVYDSNWKTTLQDLVTDVRVALTTDWTRGGKAITTQIISDQIFEAEPTNPLAEAQVTVRVFYRTLYNDPTTAY
jgi:hypothetical protein